MSCDAVYVVIMPVHPQKNQIEQKAPQLLKALPTPDGRPSSLPVAPIPPPSNSPRRYPPTNRHPLQHEHLAPCAAKAVDAEWIQAWAACAFGSSFRAPDCSGEPPKRHTGCTGACKLWPQHQLPLTGRSRALQPAGAVKTMHFYSTRLRRHRKPDFHRQADVSQPVRPPGRKPAAQPLFLKLTSGAAAPRSVNSKLYLGLELVELLVRARLSRPTEQRNAYVWFSVTPRID